MSLLALSGTNSVSGGYDIDNSTKFEADNTERMYRAWGGGGGNDQTWTVSLWVKRTELGTLQHIWGAGVSGNDVLLVSFQTDNTLKFRSTKSGADDCVYVTNRVFRDTTAWMHIVVAVDTTSGTAGDRLRIYINGVEETSFVGTSKTDFAQNDNTLHNANSSYMEIATAIGEADRFCGYIAEVISISGSQLAPTTFGEFDGDSGIWIPKAYTGSFPQNSVYLEFKDSSSLGTDTSGNGQTFTLQNITAADQATDTPTNNFATGNPLLYFSTATTVSEGATKIAKGANGWEILASTMAVTKGKWYVEVRNETIPESAMASIMPDDIELIFRGGQTLNYPGKVVGDNGQGYYSYNGNYYRNGGNESYGASWTGSTNTIGIALDMDNGKLYFAKDNTWQNSGDPTSGSTGTGAIDVLAPTKPHLIGYTPYAANTDGFINFGGYTGASISSGASDANGYGTFEYAPPSGYYALCTKNLAEYG